MVEKFPSSSTSLFLFLLSFVYLLLCWGGGGERGEEGGCQEGSIPSRFALPCASQLSFLNINKYFLFVSGKSCQQAKHPVENVICAL